MASSPLIYWPQGNMHSCSSAPSGTVRTNWSDGWLAARQLFPAERKQLLLLLSQLDESEWHRPTICPGWTVKDIALHLLGDDTSISALYERH
ncbi:MAG TPA: maleylpyruvate isomerase N-terminal domain-containing protein [Ktedonobacteraceae bacterium]|nr:maleylpyruvate isomerase N-terminal domain-containing protein [Ktedonobacteraceae bacterium]